MKLYAQILFLVFTWQTKAQRGVYVNGSIASLRVDSTSFLSIDGDFQNLACDPVTQVRFNGALYLAGSLINNDSLKFSASSGTGNSKKSRIIFRNSATYTAGLAAVIGGSAVTKFWEVEIDKPGGSVTLNANVNCLDTLEFKNGHIYMNGYKWNLIDPVGAPSVTNHPHIKNERNLSRFMPVGIVDSGLVIYKTTYTSSLNINPGNTGIELAGLMDLGSRFSVYRGFKTQVNAGKSSIHRYYDIESPAYALTASTISVKYNYNDLSYFSSNYLSLSSLKLFASPNMDINWVPLSTLQSTLVNVPGPVSDGIIKANLSELLHPNSNINGISFRVTIADQACPNPPVSGLLSDTLHICSGNTVTIDAGNNSAIPNTSLKWEWNTAPVIYDRTFTVTPDNSYKKFIVKLTDVRGCVTRDSIVVAPEAPFPVIKYFNHLNACLGDSVTIKDTVDILSGSFTNAWLFSDNSTGTHQQNQFRKKFSSSGEHAIQLTATSNHGCTVTATATNVIVYPLPTASFTNSFNCTSGVMSFSNTSVSNYSALVISGSNWNLGQGPSNTSTVTMPSQTYSSSGTYSVKLVTQSSFGCKDSVTNPVVIHPFNQALFSKNNSCHNDTITLSNLSTCNTGSCSYEWDLGDGSSSTANSLIKVYNTPGFYNVKLKVTNPVGCPDSVNNVLFVNPNPVSHFLSGVNDICINEYGYFTNSSSVSTGSIIGYQWDFGNTVTSTLTNGASNYSNSGVYNVSLTAISDSGCVNVFSLPLTVHAQPVAQYSVNNVCSGVTTQFVSGSIGAGLTYVWDFGNSVNTGTVNSSSQQIVYAGPGNYSTSLIAINNFGCSDTATVTAIVFPSPQAGLGGSVSTCGTSYTLDALNAGASFFWLPGNQTTQSIVVTNDGTYQVSITGTNGCASAETVHVTLNDIVQPKLGNDSIVCGPFILNAGYPGGVYAWNTGGSTQTITAATSGSYVVQVTDGNGCIGTDTIHLNIIPAAFLNLGANITTCKPGSGYILTPTTNANTYMWSNGSITPNIVINSSGSYWLEVTSANGCKARDTISINFLITPTVDLGADKSVCGPALLDAHNIGAAYLWNNNATSQTILPAQTGHYHVLVTNTLTGCSGQDSIFLTVHPLVNVFLGNDTTVCSNVNFQLNAGNPGSSYIWSNGAGTQQIQATSAGIYAVTVTNSGGCSATDYINIIMQGAPEVDLGNSIRYLCGNNNVPLEVNYLSGITWGSSTGLSSSQRSVQVSLPGKYWVDVLRSGCRASDTVLIIPTTQTIQAMFLASTQDTVNKPVQFVNLSEPVPTSQIWFFGDGLTSTELSPVHTFVLPQTFSVTLEVSNGFCTDRITKEINVLFRRTKQELNGTASELTLSAFYVFPNPGSDHIQVVFELSDFAPVNLSIHDLTGRVVKRTYYDNAIDQSTTLDIHDYPNGMYILNFSAASLKGAVNKSVKIIKN